MNDTRKRKRPTGRSHGARFAMAAAWVLASAAPASAQEMGQGEAHVQSVSDVKMRVDSGPATNTDRLAQVAAPLGSTLTRIKRCYADILKDRPAVEGELNVSVSLPQRGPVGVKVTRDAVGDAAVVRCAVRAIRATDFGDAPRPANALVRLTFTHSAARGVRATQERMADEQTSAVHLNAAGLPEASFAAPHGAVRFTVTSEHRRASSTVGAAYMGMRRVLPGLLDCRRKAAKHDKSPEGDIELRLLVAGDGRARARAVHSTVESQRASSCTAQAVARIRFPKEAAGLTRVLVHFAPYASEDDGETPPAAPHDAH